MMRRGWLIRLRSERGAIAVITAILLVAMFSLVALVIDIAALRADARASQTTGDFAAIAGGLSLGASTGGSPLAACMAAYEYFIANTPGLGGTPPPATACATFNGFTCDATSPAKSAVITIGPYVVTITTPIPDGDVLMQGRLDPSIDGGQCDRIAVQVRRTRAFLFGGIVNATQGQSEPPAVARSAPGHDDEVTAALIILDPTGCNALRNSGIGTAWVKHSVDPNTGEILPGIITVDSNATGPKSGGRSCENTSQNGDFAIGASGASNQKIQAGGITATLCDPVADGLILSFALMPGENAAQAYRNGDVASCALAPRPTASARITRAPIDHRYNCLPSYPTYYGAVTVLPCDEAATKPSYIKNLTDLYQPSANPAGFTNAVPLYFPGCKSKAGTTTIPPGNYYVDCSSKPQGLSISDEVIFQPGSNLVMTGDLSIGSGSGKFCFNVSSCAETPITATTTYDRFIYFRSGDFVKQAQSSVNLMRTFVYLRSGVINFIAGSGPVTWVSPTIGDANFEDLCLWSEGSGQHLLGGQANLTLEGTFFTPNAYPFNFSGQGSGTQTKAQFFSFRMEISGQGVLEMAPDPERSTPVPLAGVLLIR